MTNTSLRDYRFLGTTQSLCPDCLEVVHAKIISRGRRIYFRKRCPVHGTREDFVCSDERWFDRIDYSLPGRVPPRFALQPQRGCPYDCGLCTEHEQHTCVAVLEITSSCNLTCPLCYASSAPGGVHVPYDQCCRAIDRLVAYEGRPEILQLSGGEPTVHLEFERVFEYACDQPIDIVMINTNGVRLATDDRLREAIAQRRRRCEVYLQFDGFNDEVNRTLRGEPLLDAKLQAIERLAEAQVNVILVCTVDPSNLDQVGRIVQFGMDRPGITGVSFQPATYAGRFQPPTSLEQRVTFPDVIQAIVADAEGEWNESDFLPLPCAHPNGHTLAYAYRAGEKAVSFARFIDIGEHLDLLANGITFNRQSARELISTFISRQACGSGQDCGCGPVNLATSESIDASQASPAIPNVPILAAERCGEVANGVVKSPHAGVQDLATAFFRRAIAEDLSPADMFRITTTSFMDAYNFDIRQLMKSCVHHLLPSGHLIPFSAYNVLYRDGHVPLPPLGELVELTAHATEQASLA